ncbi:MAG: dephospho-CoA kinase [Planctomycetes bacterium]|nr:dephospho-CoA kinase [Planctomycetota bacterium]MBI3846210.1 dephospho-CoA kinase [Planctomycetota bacterium]
MIGVLAGVAGGKTTVARMFGRLGARTIDADELAHATYELPTVRRAIRRRFGREAFDSRGRLNRKRLAEEVFEDPRALGALSRIVHPVVHRAILTAIKRSRETGGTLVLDVPLLVETGLDSRCDVLVFVDTQNEKRRRRATTRRGWSPSEIDRRESVQKTVNFKRKRADYIVDNNHSKGRTFQQVSEIWSLLTTRRPERSHERSRTLARAGIPDPRARDEDRAARNT